ncbi:MAG: NAD(P)/FAD-dependent oxidoreductase [Parvibaculaceae bacterium]
MRDKEKSEAFYDDVKKKFQEERDLRLAYRPEGTAQYTSDFTGDLAGYAVDPFLKQQDVRAPLNDYSEVLFIGGGFAALLTSVRLLQKGVSDIRIVERGADVGGAWYWNRYPGIACDVLSYDYLPLLDEIEYIPTRNYSSGKEILNHCQTIARKYGLYEKAVFNTTVTETVWNEEEQLWHLGTDRGDSMRARFVICANGTLSQPKLSRIAGMGTFQGHSFHSSRWDYEYTGQELENLKDKVVGVIGTGASAVQIVPAVARAAKELYVFQRTPSSIDIRAEQDTDPDWADSLQAGWQAERRKQAIELSNMSLFQRMSTAQDVNSVDYFDKAKAAMENDAHADIPREEKIRELEKANIDYMMGIHRHIDEVVEDRKTADALKPWYMFMCKRPCFSNDYLPSFNRPNVHLVDTHGKGITRIAPEGPEFDGKIHHLDLLIYATGFEIQKTGTYNRIVGEAGLDLNQKYASGVRTLFGVHTHGFPNLFIMGGLQASYQFNLTDMLQTQGDHISECISHVKQNGYSTITPRPESEENWVQQVIKHRGKTSYNEECTPGYYNLEGASMRRQDGNYNGTFSRYFQYLKEAEADMGGSFSFT